MRLDGKWVCMAEEMAAAEERVVRSSGHSRRQTKSGRSFGCCWLWDFPARVDGGNEREGGHGGCFRQIQ